MKKFNYFHRMALLCLFTTFFTLSHFNIQAATNSNIAAIPLPLTTVDLELTAEFEAPVADAGQTLALQLSITNKGTATAENVAISADFAMVFESFSPTYEDISQGTFSGAGWNVGTLASGETAYLSFVGTVGLIEETIILFAQVETATPNDIDSTPGNDTDQTPDEDDEALTTLSNLIPIADLSFIVASGEVVQEGDIVTLTMNLINEGPATATAINVVETIPSELTILNVNATGIDSYNDNMWYIDELLIGEEATLELTVEVGELTGPISYFAQVQSFNEEDPDSTPGNNTTGIPNEDDEAKIDLIPAIVEDVDLELTTKFSTPVADAGQGVTLFLTITNKGPGTAENVTIAADFAMVFESFSPTYEDISQGTFSGAGWNVGTLTSGETAYLTFVGTAGLIEETVVLFAQVQTATPNDIDSTPGNDTDQTPDEDDEALTTLSNPTPIADLSFIVASGEVVQEGDIVTLKMNLINEGPATATAINVVETIPSELIILNVNATGIDSYNDNMWYIDELLIGEEATLELTVEVGELTSPISYFAQVQSFNEEDPDSTPGNNTTGIPNEDDEAKIDLIPATGTDIDLELNISSNVSEFNLYENVSYTIEVTNGGPANASGVQVAAMIPAGMAFTSKTESKGSYNLWAGVWTVGDLESGETATLEIVTFTLNNSGAITNFVQVKAAQQGDEDSAPNNNNTGVPIEDDEAAVTIIPAGSVDNKIDLALSKTANVSTAKAGDAIVYTIVVVNNGTTQATGVQVEDKLPSSLNAISSSASKGNFDSESGTWLIGTLDVGASATLIINTTVEVIALPITNFAQVKSAFEEDVDSTPFNNNTTTPQEDDEDSVTVLPDTSGNFVDIELTTKFSSSGQPGSPGTLYLTIINNGPADATDVSVVYDIPNEHFSSTYEVVSKGNLVFGGWSVGDLASGEGASVIFEGIVQLSTESSVFFAQVQTASPQDSDSTPGNDTDQTPDEDDEAKLIFSPSGSTDIDLEANMTSSQPNLSIYTNITFTLEVTNNSGVAASGVLAEFLIPSGMAFTSKTTSQGSYNLWSKVWTIGTLQPYETATLDLTLFVLNESNNKTLYAEVIGANQNDIDSTPNNGVYQVVAEDDETATTVLANGSGGGKNDLEANIVGKDRLLTVHRLFPVPTQNTVNLIFSSEAEIIDINLYDYTGRILHSQTLEVLPDVNTTQLDLTDFPAGVYYISMETEEGNVRTKVVKQ